MSAPVTVAQVDVGDLVSATLRALAAYHGVDYGWERSDGAEVLVVEPGCDRSATMVYVAIPRDGRDEHIASRELYADTYWGISQTVDEALASLEVPA